MSDTLRARIGAVQMAHMPDYYERDMGICPCGFKYQKWSELASHVTDAVIAELGLTRQSQTGEIVNMIEGDNINYGRHRYVTEWENDD